MLNQLLLVVAIFTGQIRTIINKSSCALRLQDFLVLSRVVDVSEKDDLAREGDRSN